MVNRLGSVISVPPPRLDFRLRRTRLSGAAYNHGQLSLVLSTAFIIAYRRHSVKNNSLNKNIFYPGSYTSPDRFFICAQLPLPSAARRHERWIWAFRRHLPPHAASFALPSTPDGAPQSPPAEPGSPVRNGRPCPLPRQYPPSAVAGCSYAPSGPHR